MVSRSRERGSALLTALLTLFLVSIAIALLAASLQLRMRLVRQEVQTVNLVTLADAALAEALAQIYVNASFAGIEEHPLGKGAIQSQVRVLETREPVYKKYEVVATGSYAGKDRAVRAVVERFFTPETADVRVEVRHWQRITGNRASG
jgi:hypothetical protein